MIFLLNDDSKLNISLRVTLFTRSASTFVYSPRDFFHIAASFLTVKVNLLREDGRKEMF